MSLRGQSQGIARDGNSSCSKFVVCNGSNGVRDIGKLSASHSKPDRSSRKSAFSAVEVALKSGLRFTY
eukprot:2564779-Rhodomonas_salina.2